MQNLGWSRGHEEVKTSHKWHQTSENLLSWHSFLRQHFLNVLLVHKVTTFCFQVVAVYCPSVMAAFT